ncbi:poly(A) polymerase [Sphingomonas vulcanisoli]|uniref:Poly(A) polymerase n=1 Tax=Sphingomonas vulcanisoli TaxID=1658060 RepID=A0ABX0TV89_9SPHN|nr:CCA tRNA nucleotidyltransferase [Sphingomonas vulcanisoli]NIJ08089.1 poly(A) polymerase [Sphingomonas vulcanisoli]
MRLPESVWRSREGLPALMAALGGDRDEVRIVGGAVRDALLGLPVADIDLGTVHAPQETVRRITGAGFKAVPTGIAHGTITAVLPSGPVEVTTLRQDLETDGRHAIVAFTNDWQADAARRDFTINALSAGALSGDIHDYFGGVADLDARLVRFIGDPLQRIAEDHLRILRFFRFHARFGTGAPDEASYAACAARARDLMSLSRERIAQELLKLLAVADPRPAIAAMLDAAILAPVLPEIDRGGLARLDRLVQIEGDLADPLRRLAALLPADPAIADTVAARLKLSNAQRRRLTLAVDTYLDSSPRLLAHAFGVEAAIDRLLLAGQAEAAQGLHGWQPPRLPITGGALIALGLAPGPKVAAALARVQRQWAEEDFPDRERLDQIAAEEVKRA